LEFSSLADSVLGQQHKKVYLQKRSSLV